jgi:imidazolonepropionase-like amidohydrolase
MRRPFIAALAALAVAGSPALAQTTAPAAVTAIWAGRLLAAPGKPVETQRTILVADGRITAVQPGYQAPSGARVIDLTAMTVLPGLIDSHVHITSENGPTGRLDSVVKSDVDEAFDGALFARRTLEAGFTTVADLGADAEAVFGLRDAIAAGKVAGPRIIASGPAITPTGGHGDAQGYRAEVLDVLRSPMACNGADDCRRAVRQAVQGGADVIKITATGGVLSNIGAGLGQQLTDAELTAIVETAHALGRRVTAHAHSKDGIEAALRAGVDSIEHGSYGDSDTFRLFRKTGAVLVPTVLAGVTVAEEAERPGTWMPAPVRAKARQVGPRMLETLRQAHLAGVRVAFGTDTGVSRHGDNARELELMVQAGFTPEEALAAATVGAAQHLRLDTVIGELTPGKAADIIAVNGDPLANISELRDVDFVMKGGTVFKSR